MSLTDSIIEANTGRSKEPEVALQKKSSRIVYLDKDSEAFAQTDSNKQTEKAEDITLLESIDANAWVYACIYKLGTSTASAPFKIFYENNDGSFSEITKEPEFKIFIYPNDWFTRFDFFEATTVYLESTGKAFWEIVKDEGGLIQEIYPLKPSNMKPIKDRLKFIKGWNYELANGKKIRYSTDQIVYLRYFNPNNPYKGLSPLMASSNAVAGDIFAEQYGLSFFKNSGRPDGLLTYEHELNDDDYDRIRKNWDKTHGGVSKGHRIGIIEQGMDYKTISTTQKDSEFIGQRKYYRDEILASFGIPPATVGVFESAIKANAETQERMFWTETMIPKLMKLAESIKLNIMPIILSAPSIGKKYDFNRIHTTFDVSKIHILIDLLAQHEDKIIEHVKNGTMSRNEARRLIQKIYGDDVTFNPFDGGDKIILPQNVNEEIGTVNRNESELKKVKLIKQDEIDIITTFTLDSPEALAVLDVEPMLIVASAESNEIVKRIIQKGLAEGVDIKDMQAEIWDRFNDTSEFSLNRTTTIARTETTQAANASTLDAYKQSGVVEGKEWLTSRDRKVRPATKFDKGDHQVLDGEVRKLDENFSNGLRYPGDQSGSPEENINCRCTMLSKVIEGEKVATLATSSDNQIIKTVLWKKFVNETERYEILIKELFLKIFESQGREYLKRTNAFSPSTANIPFTLLNPDEEAEKYKDEYSKLKEAIMLEYGQLQLDKLS
jgi:HK97 family phage portal protein